MSKLRTRLRPLVGVINLDDNTKFGSDYHFEHSNIIRYCGRGFDTSVLDENGYPLPDVDAMNEDMVFKHNLITEPDDLFIMAGDVCLGNTESTGDPDNPKLGPLDFVKRLNGRKILIAGNHDKCSFTSTKNEQKRKRMVDMYLRSGFDAVYDSVIAVYRGRKFVINHFPYEGDHGDNKDRYVYARPNFAGLPLIHGHIHDEFKARSYRGVMMVNVGIDAYGGYPQTIQDVMKRIDSNVDDDSKDAWTKSFI